MKVPEEEDREERRWRKWIEFHSKAREGFCKDLVKAVKTTNPACPVGFNVKEDERVVKYSDFVPDVWARDSKYALATGKPFRVSLEYVRTPFWGLTKSSIDMKIDMGHIAASGGSGCIVIHDGHYLISDPRNIETLSAFMKFLEKNEKYLTGVKPSCFAALLFSNQTREVYGRRDRRWYEFSYDGFYEALRQSHIQFNVLLDKDLRYDKLRKYRVLCLPNAACLSEKQIRAIEKYVNNGGGLIATHETSLYDEKGERKKDFGLAKVINGQFCSWQEIASPRIFPRPHGKLCSAT